jgi:3-mercaptopyruvate sulfurtransferase SseA
VFLSVCFPNLEFPMHPRSLPLLAVALVAAPHLAAQPAPASLVEPAQLARWIQAGYRTEKGERVIILDALPDKDAVGTWFAGDADALRAPAIRQFGADSPQAKLITGMAQKGLLGHIPGALANTSHTGLEVMERTDGPAEIEHQVGTGAAIEKLLRSHGITTDDVVVITSSQQNPPVLCSPRLWWTLSYWGFPTAKLKLLDGGNKAWALSGHPLERGVKEPAVVPSSLRLPAPAERHLASRVSLEEMIQMVDSGQTVNGGVLLFDVRQPPVAFYLKDDRKADGSAGKDGVPDLFQVPGFQYHAEGKYFTRQGESTHYTLGEMLFSPRTVAPGSPVRAAFNGAAIPPVPEDNPYLTHPHMASATGKELPVALPLSQKPTAFEGIIRGARLVKTGAYDITLPALLGPDNRFKSAEALRALFAKAGVDGTRPVVLYCNTGALSSVYLYALQEICGFKNVRMYDGSWQEWGVLTAFEPSDGTFVRRDPVLTYPAAPALQPAFWIFSAQNAYLEWDGKQFVSAGLTPAEVKKHLKPSEALSGNLRWDTLHRSEHVVFRPTETLNQPGQFQTFNPSTDWPLVDIQPTFTGPADRIRREDAAFK